MKRFFVLFTLLTAFFLCLHSGYAQEIDPPQLVNPPPGEEEEVPLQIAAVNTRTPAVVTAITTAYTDLALDTTRPEAELLAEITTLTVTSSSQLTLRSHDFEGLTALTTLDLSANQINFLPFHIFEHLTALTTLDLSKNQMRTFPSDIFNNLTALTTLDLSDNGRILTLPDGIFDELTALTTLDLSHSLDAEGEIPEDIFDELTALTTLDLGINGLRSLPDGIFDELTALTTLDLNQNEFADLPDGIFDELTALTTLHLNSLAAYQATGIIFSDDVFDELTALTTLNLNDNKLVSLSSDLFENMTALQALNLGANRLSTLPEGVFSSLSALETLSLYNNRFQTLPTGIFTGLTNLTTVELFQNSGAPFDIPITFEEVVSEDSDNESDDNRLVKARALTSTPFDIEISVSVSGDGTIVGSSDLTISAGTTTSTGSVTVDPDGVGSITVSAETLTYTIPSTIEDLNVSKGDALVIDEWAPTVTVSAPETPEKDGFIVIITFSEPVNDFVQGDLTLTDNTAEASITDWFESTDATIYHATIIPTTSGAVSISVPADVATDNAEHTNTASTTQTVTVDMVVPTVTLSNPGAWQSAAFDVGITFSEPVQKFTQEDVFLGDKNVQARGGTVATNLQNNASLLGTSSVASITNWVVSTDKTTYTATITPTGNGKVFVKVFASYAQDAAGNLNTASNTLTIGLDTQPPTVSIGVPETIQATVFDATLTFSETVEDFVQADVSLTGSTATASVTNWVASTDKITYTATITPTTSGDVSISVPASVATDVAGNNNTVSTTHTVAVDLSNPIATVSVPADTQGAAFDATITFSKPVTGFAADDITIAGTATASVTSVVADEDEMTYTATVTATASGTVEISVRANAVTDAVNRANAASGTASVTVDVDPPTVTVSVPEGTQGTEFDVTITFNEPVNDFVQGEVSFAGSTATASITNWQVSSDSTTYTATVTAEGSGTVNIQVAAEVTTDVAGNNNTASTTQIVTVDANALFVTIRRVGSQQTQNFDVKIKFNNEVTGFVQDDISLEDSTARVSITSLVSDDNTDFTASLTAKSAGVLSIHIPAGVATDTDSNSNLASQTYTENVDFAVSISDTALNAVVRDKLNISGTAALTASNMLELVDLTVENASLTDISSLEAAVNLTTLAIGGTSAGAVASLNDLTPLTGLTDLTSLTVAYAQVSNLTPLAGLTNLTSLTLTGNQISDLTALEELTALTSLSLTNNSISDVSLLAALTSLTTLSLDGNPLLDTSPLYPLLTAQGGNLATVDVTVTEYPPWDVNKDGSVNAADSALVTAALGQTGDDIVDERTDVNGDKTVDNTDLTLVTDNLDSAVDNLAPSVSISIANLVDPAVLETLDRDVLEAQLRILLAESDGSAKYRDAIAMIEAFLAAMRPDETVLLPNYPNPFNPETWIPYHLANPSQVVITIYDARGSVIRRLELGHQREGYYTSRSDAAYWDGRNNLGERVASGIYFYQFEADDTSLLRKMVILK